MNKLIDANCKLGRDETKLIETIGRDKTKLSWWCEQAIGVGSTVRKQWPQNAADDVLDPVEQLII